MRNWSKVLILAGLAVFHASAGPRARLLTKDAESGSPEAQYDLAEIHRAGDEVERNLELAAAWYEKAAVQNLPKAQYALALCHAEGSGVPRNDERALYWLNKAAGYYYAPAQYKLGESYANGELGLRKDPEEAVKWMRQAAAREFGGAFHAMGNYYLFGRGVAADEAKAVEWFQRGAARGDEKCVRMIANNFQEWSAYLTDAKPGLGLVVKQARSGDADAQLTLGRYYWSEASEPEARRMAVTWLTKAAEQGRVEADKLLVDYYLEKDRALLMKHCEKVAESGDAEYQEKLAGLYVENGAEADLKAAAHWYLKAAKQDRLESQIKCVFIYGKGTGVARDRSEAYAWALMVGHRGNKAYERALEPILSMEEKMKAMKRFRALLREIK